MDNRQYLIDERNQSDIIREIKQLAHSYTPEWRFDEKNPDIGGTIALIYANQMSDNIKKYNQLINKYHTEFVNLIGVSLQAAQPATSMVCMDVLTDTIEGIMVPSGTEFLADSSDESDEEIVFESVQNVYVTASKLENIIQVSEKKGMIKYEDKYPMNLFDFNHGEIVRKKLILYHKSIFDVVGETIYVKFIGRNSKDDINSIFTDRERFSIKYFTEEGPVPFDSVRIVGDRIALKKSGSQKKINIDGKEYSAIMIEALQPILEPIEIRTIKISAEGRPVLPEFVCNQSTELDRTEFKPFGEELAIYEECFIGNDRIFAQSGSLITLEFDMELYDNKIELSRKQVEEELKIIKKKPKVIMYDTPAETYIQEISFEYYNGKGFKKINCTTDVKKLFDKTDKGHYSIQFVCPNDFEKYVVGGNEARCVRFQIIKADNCYMRPSVHHYPVISNMTVSYSYNDNYVKPDKLAKVVGEKSEFITSLLNDEMVFQVFEPIEYFGNSTYLGFDKKFENGPISILFRLEENSLVEELNVRLEYSTISGFKRLRILDFTNKLTNTGTIMFLPPSDMAKTTIDGKEAYYLRIVDVDEKFLNPKYACPKVEEIRMNAIMVQNVESKEENEYYIDRYSANMSFELNARNILRADVYVNEKEYHSTSEMMAMIEDSRYDTRVTYNYLGEIENFFVKWSEVESFDNSVAGDRHYVLDRMSNRLIFGDGINVRIPNNLSSVAFTVKLYCCSGASGNVNENTINRMVGNLLFVGDLTNPIKGYGGSNIETVNQARKRGAAILSSGKRLISENDYIREVQAFSDNIAAVRCVMGLEKEGTEDEDVLSLVVLMKDYEDGSYSFLQIHDRLKENLVEKCELTVDEEKLKIVEPLFVKLDVSLWVDIQNMEDSFEIQNMLEERVREFIFKTQNSGGKSAKIGSIPNEQQLKMMLNSIEFDGMIERYVISARYSDYLGEHTVELSKLKDNPFVVCMNGEHVIYTGTKGMTSELRKGV